MKNLLGSLAGEDRVGPSAAATAAAAAAAETASTVASQMVMGGRVLSAAVGGRSSNNNGGGIGNNNSATTTISSLHGGGTNRSKIHNDGGGIGGEGLDGGEEKAAPDDDEVADLLLVQFPTYGTKSQALNIHSHSQWHDKTADWLLGGTSNIPTPKQQLLQQQLLMQQQQQQLTMLTEDGGSMMGAAGGISDLAAASSADAALARQVPSAAAVAVTVGAAVPNRLFRDWADDEQVLWRSNKFGEYRMKSQLAREASSAHGGGTARPGTTSCSTEAYVYQRPQLEDPSQDLLAAYYYHVGVMPEPPSPEQRSSFDRESRLPLRQQQQLQLQQHLDPQSHRPRERTKPSPFNSYRHSPFDVEVPFILEDDAQLSGDEGGDEDPHASPVGSEAKTYGAILGVGKGSTGVSGSNSISHERLGTAAVVAEDRQHWMPDRLCKTCYSCDTPFTVFRRRHHCRICGQVFCNTCSGYFIPAAGPGKAGRAASALTSALLAGSVSAPSPPSPQVQHHAQQQQQQQQQLQQTSNHPSQQPPGAGHGTGPGVVTGGSPILRACKMCFDQMVAQQKLKKFSEDEAAAAAADAAGRKRRKKDEPPLTPSQPPYGGDPNSSISSVGGVIGTPQAVHVTPNKGGGTPGGNGDDPASPHPSPSLRDQLEGEDSSVLRQLSKRRGGDTPLAQKRLQSQEQALMEQEEKEQTALLLQQQQKHHLQLQKQQQQLLQQNDVPDMIATTPPSPLPSLEQRTGRTSPASQQQAQSDDRAVAVREGNRHMGLIAASHLEQMATALLETDAPLLWKGVCSPGGDDGKGNALAPEEASVLRSKWVNKLMGLATRCCATVDPNIKRGDMLDIRPYVKIKGKHSLEHCCGGEGFVAHLHHRLLRLPHIFKL